MSPKKSSAPSRDLGKTKQVLSPALKLGFEVDGLDDVLIEGDQVMFDLVGDREGCREKQGYVTPADIVENLKAGLESFKTILGKVAAFK
jgi:hypothetical protein